MFGELLFQLVGSIKCLPALIFCQTFVHLPGEHWFRLDLSSKMPFAAVCKHSHDVLHTLGLNEDGDGMELSQLESFDGIS